MYKISNTSFPSYTSRIPDIASKFVVSEELLQGRLEQIARLQVYVLRVILIQLVDMCMTKGFKSFVEPSTY